ncbi:MAG: hypothetical protein ACREIH_00190 [Nitrospiraceae bacterium]
MFRADNFNAGYVLLAALLAPALAYGSVFLTGGGHAPLIGYVPFLLVTGPLAVLLQALDLRDDTQMFAFLIVGSFLLYLLYGAILWLSTARFPNQYGFIFKVILSLHLLAGVILVYRGMI